MKALLRQSRQLPTSPLPQPLLMSPQRLLLQLITVLALRNAVATKAVVAVAVATKAVAVAAAKVAAVLVAVDAVVAVHAVKSAPQSPMTKATNFPKKSSLSTAVRKLSKAVGASVSRPS